MIFSVPFKKRAPHISLCYNNKKIVKHAHLFKHPNVLKRTRDAVAPRIVRLQPFQSHSVNNNHAIIFWNHAGKNVCERCLAASVWTDDAGDCSIRNRKRKPINRENAVKVFGKIFGFYDIHCSFLYSTNSPFFTIRNTNSLSRTFPLSSNVRSPLAPWYPFVVRNAVAMSVFASSLASSVSSLSVTVLAIICKVSYACAPNWMGFR